MTKSEIISKILNLCYVKLCLSPDVYIHFNTIMVKRWYNSYNKGTLLYSLNHDFGFQNFFIDFKDCLDCYKKEFCC